MTLIVDRTNASIGENEPTAEPVEERRRIEVTELHTAGIEGFVDSSVDTDCVSLEHRGGRTYLVLEE
ncbi:hypothetical protein [Natrarchaeobaculum sulfurireducens]|uniref:Uncharacterized protein n=1 Tax=Natrarchaeobaculum sulfurireducens TaxID=2044521 RepID=A0A346PTB1_9EURY|nr:hypothetical protein [Natrarchaeobaculum sulfurireducens]AXR77281.1 hypothetical protein AArc1_0940 [Natrarchaeobaculum sulfurireducens]AXR82756.1 hypothetical protein AArcMg_2766 [Natrarchaeobaculum sulfurireducens]